MKLLAFGDTRTNPASFNTVAARMSTSYTADPAFQSVLLHSGDWIATDAEADWTSQWFTRSQSGIMKLLSEMPVIGARGNHEGSGAVYKKYYPITYAAGFYRSFDYGPVHVVVVDNYTSFTQGSAQHTWLTNDLASTTKPWKIVTFHEPGWGAGDHSNNTTVQTVLQPLFKTYGVDLVVTGHNHNYAHAIVDGIHHLTLGGGGAPLYTPVATWPNIVKVDESLHFGEISVNDSTASVVVRRSNGTVIETIAMTHSSAPVNQSPVANAGVDQTLTDADNGGSESVVLNGSASSDPDGTISSYVWKEGTTQIATGASPTVSLTTGSHTIALTVTDNGGKTAVDNVVITINPAGGATPVTISKRVATGTDDAEQYQSGGTMYLNSTDLELVNDGTTIGNQTVGLRFTGMTIPKGAVITSAYIQFTADEKGKSATSLVIAGQSADNPTTFTSALNNITSRTRTTATVSWAPASWSTIGQAAAAQKTPDIKAVVQEIVNRAGWVSGNSMVMIVTGTGKRTAEAYEGSASQAPQLIVTYTMPLARGVVTEDATPIVAPLAPAVSVVTPSISVSSGMVSVHNAEHAPFQIYSMQGRELLSGSTGSSGTGIDGRSLAVGSYIIRLQTVAGVKAFRFTR